MSFLNVDVDVRSRADLTPLRAHLGGRIFVLSDETKVPGHHFLSFELTEEPACTREARAETLIAAICGMIEALPPELRAMWDGCVLKDFNLGFDSGVCRGRSAQLNEWRLAADTIHRVAALGATITVTLYPLFEVPAAVVTRLQGSRARGRHTRRRGRVR